MKSSIVLNNEATFGLIQQEIRWAATWSEAVTIITARGTGIRSQSLRQRSVILVRNFFYHSFPEPQSPLLPPGRSVLIKPFKTVNALAGRAARGQATGGGGSQSSPGDASAIQQLASADIIRISVDLAVASDGRTAGPDAARTARIRD